MKYVHLGSSNLQVSEFCLGTMMFGGKTSKEESTKIIHRAIDAGVTFIDTADIYNEGRSEEITGAALSDRRERVVLASKVGMKVGASPTDQGISRYHIIRGVEASLRRLGTDRIDLLYVHWPVERMNLEEMARALEHLIASGKVLYPACSNFPAWVLTRTLWIEELAGFAPMIAGQYPYNLIERGVEVELLPAAKALGVGITVYRPLAIGVLTGKYAGAAPAEARGESDERIPRWNRRYARGVRRLGEYAEKRGHVPGEAAIRWVCSHPAVSSAIVGVSRMEQLEANLRAFEWEMSDADRARLGGYFPTAVWEEGGGAFVDWRRSFEIDGSANG